MHTRIKNYDYFLPPELVAQHPLRERDTSRLLVLRRADGQIRHASFRDLPQYLDADDLLVLNDTRVFPARLHGAKASGGKIELLLHHLPEAEREEAEKFGGGGQGLPQAGKPATAAPAPSPQTQTGRARATYRGRLKVGQELVFGERLRAEVVSLPQPGVAEVSFRSLNGGDPSQLVLEQGEVPLPPYIRRPLQDSDQESYQTVYAARVGAVACPTAGLHFTEAVMGELAARGIEAVSLTLHVGPGTFMPVRHEDYTQHQLEPEYFELSQAAAQRLNRARRQGQRIVAVGTTSVRVLESCAGPQGFASKTGWCDLYIHPGYRFQVVDPTMSSPGQHDF